VGNLSAVLSSADMLPLMMWTRLCPGAPEGLRPDLHRKFMRRFDMPGAKHEPTSATTNGPCSQLRGAARE